MQYSQTACSSYSQFYILRISVEVSSIADIVKDFASYSYAHKEILTTAFNFLAKVAIIYDYNNYIATYIL